MCARMREEKKESMRVREKTQKAQGGRILWLQPEKGKKKKKAFWFTSSLTLRRAAVVHPVSSLSFSLSLPPRTQWINQIPAHFFPFPSFFSGFISSAVFECTWRDPHLTFKFGWHWSAPQTFSCGEEEKKKTVQRLFFFFFFFWCYTFRAVWSACHTFIVCSLEHLYYFCQGGYVFTPRPLDGLGGSSSRITQNYPTYFLWSLDVGWSRPWTDPVNFWCRSRIFFSLSLNQNQNILHWSLRRKTITIKIE